MKLLHGFLTLIGILAAPVASAILVSLFPDIDTYLDRGRNIVVAKYMSVQKQGYGIESLDTIEVDVIRTLKGPHKPGKLLIDALQKPILGGETYHLGKTYLFYSLASGLDFEAIPELSMVEVSPDFDLKRLDGLSLREQVHLIFRVRLDVVNRLLKDIPKERLPKENDLLEEKELLEKATAK